MWTSHGSLFLLAIRFCPPFASILRPQIRRSPRIGCPVPDLVGIHPSRYTEIQDGCNQGWVSFRQNLKLFMRCLHTENDLQDSGIAGSAIVGDVIQVRLSNPRRSFPTQQLSDPRPPPRSQNRTSTNQDPDHVSRMQSGDSTTRGQVCRTACYVPETWRFSCH